MGFFLFQLQLVADWLAAPERSRNESLTYSATSEEACRNIHSAIDMRPA